MSGTQRQFWKLSCIIEILCVRIEVSNGLEMWTYMWIGDDVWISCVDVSVWVMPQNMLLGGKQQNNTIQHKTALTVQQIAGHLKTLAILDIKTAVALALEQLRSPHASEREICVQKVGNAYRRNERNEWRISGALLPPSNDSAKYWNDVHKRCALSFHNTCVPSVICRMCSLRRVETESRFLHLYASLQSMLLRTARFLCVLDAEICVTATADKNHVPIQIRAGFMCTLLIQLKSLQTVYFTWPVNVW